MKNLRRHEDFCKFYEEIKKKMTRSVKTLQNFGEKLGDLKRFIYFYQPLITLVRLIIITQQGN